MFGYIGLVGATISIAGLSMTVWAHHMLVTGQVLLPFFSFMSFLVTFLIGGLTGVILASPPLDFHVSDTYFVVAHIHHVVFGTVVFAMFSGCYFWWPKMTGRMLDDRLGKLHFWPLFIGFEATFLVQFWLGTIAFPRRGRRPVGVRQLAGVGQVLPAAATQLLFAAPGQVRAARLRPEISTPAART